MKYAITSNVINHAFTNDVIKYPIRNYVFNFAITNDVIKYAITIDVINEMIFLLCPNTPVQTLNGTCFFLTTIYLLSPRG